mgnify:CR=1 FL=1
MTNRGDIIPNNYICQANAIFKCFIANLNSAINCYFPQITTIRKCVIFDFADTNFMDSSGIGLLMGRYKLMRALGGTVRIVHAGERIQKILMLSGIHKIIQIEKEN